MRHHGRKKSSVILVGILLAVILVGLLAVHVWEQRQLAQERENYVDDGYIPTKRPILEYEGRRYRMRDGIETYLVIGVDKFSTEELDPLAYVNDQQSDFLILMIADHDNQNLTALHINRDTMAEIERYGLAGRKVGSFTGQLALSHTFGSGKRDSARYTTEAVSRFLFDIPMDHYSVLGMDAIPVLNDLVGGVSVYVEDDFGELDKELKQGTTVRLQGDHALTFVRARSGMPEQTNINRMQRQRTYMHGLYQEMKRCLNEDENFSLRLATELADYMISDLNIYELSDLAENWKLYDYAGIETIEGEAVLGERFIEFYPDMDALLQQVLRLMFEPA